MIIEILKNMLIFSFFSFGVVAAIISLIILAFLFHKDCEGSRIGTFIIFLIVFFLSVSAFTYGNEIKKKKNMTTPCKHEAVPLWQDKDI